MRVHVPRPVRPYVLGAALALIGFLPWLLAADNLLAPTTQQFTLDQSFTASLSNGVDTITIPLKGYNGLSIGVTGLGSNTAICQVSNDGVNFNHSTLWQCGGSSAVPRGRGVTAMFTNARFIVLDTAGMTHAQISISTFVAGTTTFTINLNQIPPGPQSGAMSTDLETVASRSVLSGLRGSVNQTAARTPDTFKTVAGITAAGNTAVWTPAAGKKFRLMRFRIHASGTPVFVTTAGDVTVTFQDAGAATNIVTEKIRVGTVAVTGMLTEGTWVDLGNGFLSATANNALNANLVLGGVGAFSGGIDVDVCGTEE